MSIAGPVILLIIAACIAYQYMKGTFVKAFGTMIIAVCASVVAFGYFEMLANFFITRGQSSRYPAILPWAQPLSFVLLLVLAFGLLQTLLGYLTRRPVDFGPVADRVGRVICGFFLGLFAAGLLLVLLAMAPLPTNYPYQRFDSARPDAEKPSKVLFNADGFAAGWFRTMSAGSFSGNKSFAAIHPNFIDQAFLNRYGASNDVPLTCSPNLIELPKRTAQAKAAAVWPAPQTLKDSTGRPIPPKPQNLLLIARAGIRGSEASGGLKFTLSQLRLICRHKTEADKPLLGKAINVYPLGYMQTAEEVVTKRLGEVITLKRTDFSSEEPIKWVDFIFYVPEDFVPLLLQFKQNCILQVPPMVSAEEAPPIVPFETEPPPEKKTREPNAPEPQPPTRRFKR